MKYQFKHRVNYYETDAMNVVHHSNYIRWFEIGRVEFLRQNNLTLDEIRAAGYLFPITKVECKYLNSAKFDDIVRIEITPVHLTKVKLEFSYQIYNDQTNVLLVEGFTQSVFTHETTGHIARLPERFHQILTHAMQER